MKLSASDSTPAQAKKLASHQRLVNESAPFQTVLKHLEAVDGPETLRVFNLDGTCAGAHQFALQAFFCPRSAKDPVTALLKHRTLQLRAALDKSVAGGYFFGLRPFRLSDSDFKNISNMALKNIDLDTFFWNFHVGINADGMATFPRRPLKWAIMPCPRGLQRMPAHLALNKA